MVTDKLVGNKLRNFAAVNWFLLIAWLVGLKFDLLKYAGQPIGKLIENPTVLVIVCFVGYVYLFIRFWFDYKIKREDIFYNQKGSQYHFKFNRLIRKYMNKKYKLVKDYTSVQITEGLGFTRNTIKYKATFTFVDKPKSGKQEEGAVLPKFNLLRRLLYHIMSMFKASKSDSVIGDFFVTFALMHINAILYGINFIIYIA